MFDGNAELSGYAEDCMWVEISIYLVRFLHCFLNCISQWMWKPSCLFQLSGVQVKHVQLLMNSDLINYHSHQLIDWVSVKLCSIFCNSLVGHLRVTICRFLQRKESYMLFFFFSRDEGRTNSGISKQRAHLAKKQIQWYRKKFLL